MLHSNESVQVNCPSVIVIQGMMLLDFYLRECDPKGGTSSRCPHWSGLFPPPPPPYFTQENDSSMRDLIYESVQSLHHIMQTRDATSICLFTHPACTRTKLTYYANCKHFNIKKKRQSLCKHTSPHLTREYSHALLVSFPSKGAFQIAGCSLFPECFTKP